MGFGWNMAPYIFEEITRCLTLHTEKLFGLRSWGYLDDILNTQVGKGAEQQLEEKTL